MNTRIVTEKNLFVSNEIYFPDEFRENHLSRVAVPAISAVTSFEIIEGFPLAVENSRCALDRFLGNDISCIFLCVQDCFFEASAVVRARSLWKSSPAFEAVRKTAAEIGPVCSVQKDARIRYFALLKVSWRDAFHVLEAGRQTGSCFGIIGGSQSLTKELTCHYFELGFGRNVEAGINWPSLVFSSISERLCFLRPARNQLMQHLLYEKVTR